jgi:hypothetical protein
VDNKLIYGSFFPVCFPVFAQVGKLDQILEKPKFIPNRKGTHLKQKSTLLC